MIRATGVGNRHQVPLAVFRSGSKLRRMQEENRNWQFRYAVPQPPRGIQVQLTAEDAEKMLLARLADPKENRGDALWELARFYCAVKRYDEAISRLREIIAATDDMEDKAACVLALGQTMEQGGNYDAAVKFYREAFALEPTRTSTWYFINNNLGFCLNTLGHPDEGETFCRAAMEINPDLPNGHKNLGISLAAQGRYRRAAQCYVQATKVNASDTRSLRLLRELLNEHEDLRGEFEIDLRCCEEAVKVAQEAVKRATSAN